jgi:hypothetical protein
MARRSGPDLRLIAGVALIATTFFGCFALYSALPEDALQSPDNGSTGPATRTPRPTSTTVVPLLGTPAPTPSPRLQPGGAQVQPAPIESAEVVVQESAPPRYVLRLVAGLPSGCAQQGRVELSSSGQTFSVAVLNYIVGGPICTQVYGTYELNLPLASGLQPGATYEVELNDQRLSFVAQ